MKLSINLLTLQQKLYLFILPTVIFTCLFISWVFYSDLRSGTEEQMRREITNNAAQAESKVFTHSRAAMADIDFFAGTEPLKTMLSSPRYRERVLSQDSVLAFFEQLQSAKQEYREMYILENHGDLFASHADDLFYQVEEDKRWINTLYLMMRADPDNRSQSLIIEAQGGPRLAIISPVLGERLNTIGYVLLTQDMRAFHALSFEFSPNGGSSIVHRNRDGMILHDLDDTTQKLLSAFGDDEKLSSYVADETRWHAFKQQTNFGDIIVFQNATDYYEQLDELLYQTTGITAGVTLLFTLLVWALVTKLILKPLRHVSKAAKEIANGTYKQRSLPRGRDEIGTLCSSIDSMAKSINNHTLRIEQLAYFDDLTGLNNKQLFLEHVRQYMDPVFCCDLAAWVVDLNKFKQINDIHGYDIGNEVLRAVGERLKSIAASFAKRHNLNPKNFLVARADGDEFLLFSELTQQDGLAEGFARTISEQIKTPFLIGEHEFKLECFIGWEHGGESGFAIYEKADMAMHEAKNTMAPLMRFDDELLKRVIRNQQLSDNIKRALEINEFTLYYQPKCHTQTPENVTEFEALIRWPTEQGFISPGIFIPFAEDANLIQAIDSWVCEHVIKDVADLEGRGWRDFVVSFNVSGQRLSDPAFIKALKEWVEHYRIMPQHLQVEITEHSLIHDTKSTKEAILQLREIGLSVALDDFGTGHSSLGYLKDLPINTLKIDRCFVQDVHADHHKQVILEHIIKIGQDLGLQIVAEGVEYEEEMNVLRRFECDLVQGFLFYKPLPYDTIIDKFDEALTSDDVPGAAHKGPLYAVS